MKTIFSQKGSIGLVVLVIVLSVVILAGAVGGTVYYNKIKNNNELDSILTRMQTEKPDEDIALDETANTTGDSSAEEATETEIADPTTSWKTYTNDVYKFSIKYPDKYYMQNKLYDGPPAEKIETNDFMAIGKSSDNVLMQEGCTGLYFLAISNIGTGQFSDFSQTNQYPHLDNASIIKSQIGGKDAYTIGGNYNDNAVYDRKGEKAYFVNIDLAPDKYIYFGLCKPNSMKGEYEGSTVEFDQILSTFQFTK